MLRNQCANIIKLLAHSIVSCLLVILFSVDPLFAQVTPTQTLITTPTSCSEKIHGDANCDNHIDLLDFEVFRSEFIGLRSGTKQAPFEADFNTDGTVDLLDFEIFRQGYISAKITPTATSSATPVPTSPPISGVCTYTMTTSIDSPQVKPGDIICIKAGTVDAIKITGITGSATNPVIIRNESGQVVVTGGISVEKSKYFRFSGAFSPEIPYGIKVQTASYTGLIFSEGTTDYELDHIEIDGSKGTTIGMGLHTSAGVFTQANFTQRNTKIHDNYVHNVAGEGMYIGKNNTLLGKEPILEGLWVYDNKISFAGRDGINVKGTPKDCFIYRNQIDHDTQGKDQGQQGGITAVLNTKCDIYNNTVKDGFGPGIQDNGMGGNTIYNNTITNPGQGWNSTQGYGIHIQSGHSGAGKTIIKGNTITNPLIKDYYLGDRGELQ